MPSDFDGTVICSICTCQCSNALDVRIKAMKGEIAYCLDNRERQKAKRLERELKTLLKKHKDIKGTTDIGAETNGH